MSDRLYQYILDCQCHKVNIKHLDQKNLFTSIKITCQEKTHSESHNLKNLHLRCLAVQGRGMDSERMEGDRDKGVRGERESRGFEREEGGG
jgi:hypothetical protein